MTLLSHINQLETFDVSQSPDQLMAREEKHNLLTQIKSSFVVLGDNCPVRNK